MTMGPADIIENDLGIVAMGSRDGEPLAPEEQAAFFNGPAKRVSEFLKEEYAKVELE